nr:unnamed protein product [Spirometra erinaceieuropaei]
MAFLFLVISVHKGYIRRMDETQHSNRRNRRSPLVLHKLGLSAVACAWVCLRRDRLVVPPPHPLLPHLYRVSKTRQSQDDRRQTWTMPTSHRFTT